MSNCRLIDIIKKIEDYDVIIIHRHLRPDGDCIGSQMGLKEILQSSYPEKRVYVVGDEVPEYVSFLGSNDVLEDEVYSGALCIVVDTSISERICDSRWKLAKEVIKIDHHDDSNPYSEIEYIDPNIPANSAIIVQLYNEARENYGWVLNKSAATALYVGIVSDTGRFQYRGVNSITMNLAGQLLDAGIEVDAIYSRLYVKKMETFMLQGYVYSHVKFTANGVAYIHFTEKTMDKYNVTCEDASSMVNLLSGIFGSLIWVTFVDYPDHTRVRLRSRGPIVNDIGGLFRGGGHLLASGATVYNLKEKRAILGEVDRRLLEYKTTHPEEN